MSQDGKDTFLLDAFEVTQCEKMERFILNHEDILPHMTCLEGFEKGKEHVILGKGLSYNKLIEIVKGSLKLFAHDSDDEKKSNYEELKRHQEIDRIELFNESKRLDLLLIASLSALGGITSEQIFEKLGHDEVDTQIECAEEVPESNQMIIDVPVEPLSVKQNLDVFQVQNGNMASTNGPRIQKLDSISFDIIDTYDTLTAAAKGNPTLHITKRAIKEASENNWIEGGFRWLRVPRELNHKEKHFVPSTVLRKNGKKGWVAKLSPNRLKILEVYKNALSASKENNISKGAISVALNTGNPSLKHYFELWSDANHDLKDDYVSLNGEIRFPGEYPIKCYSKESGCLFGEYTDKENAKLNLGISSKTVNALLLGENNHNKSYRLEWDHS